MTFWLGFLGGLVIVAGIAWICWVIADICGAWDEVEL